MAVITGVSGSGGGGGGAVTQSGAWNVTLLAGSAVVGAVTQSGTWNVTVNTALPAGTNSIGTVVLGAGAAAVGTVGVTSLPALPTGANVIGAVTQSGTWNVTVNTALPAGANSIGTVVLGAGVAAVGTVGVTSLPALATGGNVIGAVTQSGTWNVTVNAALPTGGNVIGAVTQSGTWTVTAAGSKTSNGGAADGTNIGVLPAIATTAAPSYTTGNQVALSTDLAGSLRSAVTSLPSLATGANTIGAVTQASGPWTVQGAAAAGTALAGNPVRVGISDGTNTQDWKQSSASTGSASGAGIPGVAMMALGSGVYQELRSVTATDGGGVNGAMLNTWALPMLYNGTTADRARNNVDVTLLASAARTTTQTGSNITAYNCQALIVTLDVTAITATCSLTVTINYIDPASGKSITLLSSAVIAAVSTTMLMVDPRIVAAANLVGQKSTGRVFTITVTVGNANSQTYSVGYTLVPC